MTTRQRTRGTPEPVYGDVTQYYNGSPSSTRTITESKDYEVITDTVTPNYASRIRNGDIINTNCSYVVSKIQTGSGRYYATLDANPSNNYETPTGSVTSFQMQAKGVLQLTEDNVSVDVDQLIEVAKLQAIANIDSSPYAFMEDAFELRETLRFLRDPLGKTAKLAKSMRSTAIKKGGGKRRLAKNLSDSYLEYRFAFTPLMRSAIDAVEAYNSESKRPVRQTARGFGNGKDTVTQMTYPDAYDTFSQKIGIDVSVHAGILYEVTNPVNDVAFRLGFRAKDIPETLWAVMPYSFMVDRVVNISDAIRGLTNLLDPKVKILAGWVRLKKNIQQETVYESQTVPGWTVEVTGDTVMTKNGLYSRVIWTPSPFDIIPPANAKGLVKDITSTLDLAALIYKRLV